MNELQVLGVALLTVGIAGITAGYVYDNLVYLLGGAVIVFGSLTAVSTLVFDSLST